MYQARHTGWLQAGAICNGILARKKQPVTMTGYFIQKLVDGSWKIDRLSPLEKTFNRLC